MALFLLMRLVNEQLIIPSSWPPIHVVCHSAMWNYMFRWPAGILLRHHYGGPLPLRHIHTPVSKPSWLRSFTGQFLFVHICAYLFHFFRNTSVAQTHADPNKYMNTGSTRLTLLYLREHCRGHRYWSQILLEP